MNKTINSVIPDGLLTMIILLSAMHISLAQEVNYADFSPRIVTDDEPFTIYMDVASDDVDSIKIVGFGLGIYFRSLTAKFGFRDTLMSIDGIPRADVILRDDGQGMDEIAGDNIFTSRDLVWDWSRDVAKETVFLYTAEMMWYLSDQTTVEESRRLGIALGYLPHDDVSELNITAYNDHIQHTDYVVNFSIDYDYMDFSDDLSGLEVDALVELFDGYLKDDNREFIFAYSFPIFPSRPGFHRTLNQDVENICMSLIESRWPTEGITYGFKDLALGSLFIHEYLHRYAAHCGDEGLPIVIPGAHWTPIEFEDNGFSPSYWDFQPYNGDTISVRYAVATSPVGLRSYNALELYLMGRGTIDEIPWPIRYIEDADFVGFVPDADPLRRLYTGTVKSLSKEEFLNVTGGLRSPLMEPDTLMTTCFVFSDGLLSDRELLYYDLQARQAEVESDSLTLVNLYFATKGRLFHRTKLRFAETTTATDDYVDSGLVIDIFPNPATDHIEVVSDVKVQLKVFDMGGKQVYSDGTTSRSRSVDISGLEEGAYMVECLDPISRARVIKKVVVVE